MYDRLIKTLQERAKGEEMSIGSQVAKQFQDEGHAYYDELVEMVDSRIAALESALTTERARADTLAAALNGVVRDEDGYLFARTYGQTDVVIPREMWAQIRAALAAHRQARDE